MITATLSTILTLSFLGSLAAEHPDAVIAEPDASANDLIAVGSTTADGDDVPLSAAGAAHTPAPERQPGLCELSSTQNRSTIPSTPTVATTPSSMPVESTTPPHTSDRLTPALRPNPVLAHEAHLGRIMKDWGVLSIVLGGIGLAYGGFFALSDYVEATGYPFGGSTHRTKARGPLIMGAGAAVVTWGIMLLRGGSARRYAAAEAWNAEHPDQPVVY